jgi:hypothetical protein
MTRSRSLASIAAALGLVATSAVQAQINGTLGVYFDDRGTECTSTLAPGAARFLYVLVLPEGDTRRGISGVEFRLDVSRAPGYSFSRETVIMPEVAVWVGTAVGGDPGLNLSFTRGCESRFPVPIIRLQVQNLGGGTDGVVAVAPRNPPTNRNFPCALVTLCDDPVFTAICITPGIAVLNPSGSIKCGSSAEASEWGRVKELYR